jgi:lipid-binding SYLF domain-containing protein
MKSFTTTTSLAAAAIFAAGSIAACSTYRASGGDLENPRPASQTATSDGIHDEPRATSSSRLDLEEQATITLDRLVERDPSLRRFIDNAHGYVVIPEVTKGAVGIGAARGHGVVFEQGQVIGYTTMTQGSVGAQLGGQVYSQVMFFEDAVTLDRFKRGNMELSARASAVAAAAGAAAEADFEEGIAIFALPRTGLMFEAAVGGQKFTFEPKQ